MLRNILIGLSLLVAILQFPGLPHDIVRWLSMLSGLAILFLLYVSRHGEPHTAELAEGERSNDYTGGK